MTKLIIILILFFLPYFTLADNFSQWPGPNRDGKILCVSGYKKSLSTILLKLVKVGKSENILWQDKRCDNLIGGVILKKEYLYGSRYDKDEWFCLDWDTGKDIYFSRVLGSGAIVYADDSFYLYTEQDEVSLVKADSRQFKIISSFPVKNGSGPHWAHSVISAGRLYKCHGDALMVYAISKKWQLRS